MDKEIIKLFILQNPNEKILIGIINSLFYAQTHLPKIKTLPNAGEIRTKSNHLQNITNNSNLISEN